MKAVIGISALTIGLVAGALLHKSFPRFMPWILSRGDAYGTRY